MIAERLRAETKTAHAALEKTMMPLLRAATNAPAYAHLLRRMHDFLTPVEAAVFAVIGPQVLPDADTRRSAARLAADLAVLAVPAPSESAPPVLPPKLEDVGRAWGALYVLEGSTLGGRVVREIVLRQFPAAAGATTYFDGYGAATEDRWSAFKTALEQWTAAHPEEADAVVTGAEDTFTAFRAWLQKPTLSA